MNISKLENIALSLFSLGHIVIMSLSVKIVAIDPGWLLVVSAFNLSYGSPQHDKGTLHVSVLNYSGPLHFVKSPASKSTFENYGNTCALLCSVK